MIKQPTEMINTAPKMTHRSLTFWVSLTGSSATIATTKPTTKYTHRDFKKDFTTDLKILFIVPPALLEFWKVSPP